MVLDFLRATDAHHILLMASSGRFPAVAE